MESGRPANHLDSDSTTDATNPNALKNRSGKAADDGSDGKGAYVEELK